VRDVAVFGVPHEKQGETPLAAVVLKQPQAATAEEIRERNTTGEPGFRAHRLRYSLPTRFTNTPRLS